MFEINGRSISLTRGDTARFEVSITNTVTGEPYTIEENDILTMTVRGTSKSPVEFRSQSLGTSLLHIKPEDTEHMYFGEYVYDIELRTSSGDVYTVIPLSEFTVLPEASY